MARFQDLSPEDQALLNTDFGDYEKQAAEQVAVTQYVYTQGSQFASNAADEMDKIASEEASDELSLDEESKTAAEEMGAFMARGYFDSLVKEGQERHGDPLHYLFPLLEQKVASIGGVKMAGKFTEFAGRAEHHAGRAAGYAKSKGQAAAGYARKGYEAAKSKASAGYEAAKSKASAGYEAAKSKTKGGYGKAKGAVSDYNAGMINDLRGKGSSNSPFAGRTSDGRSGTDLHGKARVYAAARGALKATPYAAVGGSMLGGGAIVTRELGGNSKDRK